MPYHFDQRRHALAAMVERIQRAVYTPVADLAVTAWVTKEPVPFAERTAGRKLELRPGDKWGDLFDCAWFHFAGRVPESAAGRQVVLLIDVNGEACVVDANGVPQQGLTNVNSEFDYSLGKPGKRVVPFADKAAGGEEVDLWADAGCNDLFGRLRENGTLKEARIAVCHPELHALSYDFEVLHELMEQLPQDSARWHRIWAALDGAARQLDRFTDEEAAAARAILAPELARRGCDAPLTIGAIGHAHMDLGWLWPIRETIRKGARTFSTVLHFMERYPEYVFGASQPQLYQWMKDHYPELYARIKERVAEGRIEAQGAMWVEADTNVPSGESLARQLLYGKRFFRAEFGKEVTNLWLPDVFGYSGALPQLLRKAGVPYFLTQKLSWNLVNHYPHHTFCWQGIDGSRVLAHLPPEDTYNSSAAPRALAKAERNFHDKSLSDRCLLVFGIGDGGGGPGEEHLERLRRERNLQGLAPTVQETAEQFFAQIDHDTERLPVWAGELYLERHQGTYTTQARNKRFNRKMEIALREAEAAAALASFAVGRPYPQAELEAIWKEVLLYQFHDILPGSSITRVYDESRARYAALLEQTERLAAEAAASLLADVNTAGMREPVVVTNSLSWERTEFVRANGKLLKVTVPALGYTVADAAGAPPALPSPVIRWSSDGGSLENDILRVTFNGDGSLASVFDKENGREALLPGAAGNRLAVYHDPGDAWDFPMDYAERAPERFVLKRAEPFAGGPRAGLRQTYAYGSSTLTQEVALTAGSRRLEFVTHVDWRESGKMLRTSFPLAVQTAESTSEIQFGSIRRPTHRNTSWDSARFEICAHKWIDLSERGYGVALLNDCKYGHKAVGTTLDLNLLRSPGHPDPTADRAEHDFTYALFPHAGDHAAGGVIREAYALNVPLRVLPAPAPAGSAPASASLLSIDAPNVVLEAVKKAEDGGDLVLRLYEAHGEAVQARLTPGVPFASASLVDLMEEHPQPLPVAGGQITVPFRPFEVQTVRIGR